MLKRRIFILLIWLITQVIAHAQTDTPTILYVHPEKNNSFKLPPNFKLAGISDIKCKNAYLIFIDTSVNQLVTPLPKASVVIAKENKIDKPAFLKIHGNVVYDYFYQSYLDTPYSGSSLQQHTISTYLDITVKEAYPLKMSFSTRLGNPNYLRNLSALNLRFDQSAFVKMVKQEAQDWIARQLNPDSTLLLNLKDSFDHKQFEHKELKRWLNSHSVRQALIAEEERRQGNLSRSKNVQSGATSMASASDQLKNNSSSEWSKQIQDEAARQVGNKTKDSAINSFSQNYYRQQARLDTIKRTVDSLWAEYQKEKHRLDSSKNAIASSVNDLKNPQKWKDGLKKLTGVDTVLPKGYNALLSLRKLSIGTAVVDYSELSAKNVTINGLQVEYAPRLYYAVAGGVINYRFRDYMLPESAGPKQYLGLVRFGKGKPESNHLIFTYYFGKKQLYNYLINDSNGSVQNSNSSLMGITLEKKVLITKNISLSAEVAKSTVPYFNRIDQNSKLTQGAFSLSDHSNEAYSIKAEAVFPSSHTKLDGYYKHYGENFQSFTLFSTNTRQNAWLAHAEQTLLKNQLTINASVRKNDYINPFLNQAYTTNIIFKSIQATLHLKKLPVVSIGYYPTSQLTKISEDKYSENLFYNLIGSVSYYYRIRGVQMNSSLVASKFYNKPLDSGFVYYNSRNVLLNHIILIKKFNISGAFTESITNDYYLYTLNGGLQWKAKKWLSLGSSIKYNRQSIVKRPQIGYGLNSAFIIPQIGNIQLRIQKSYVPGPEAKLVPDNIGRLTYSRNF